MPTADTGSRRRGRGNSPSWCSSIGPGGAIACRHRDRRWQTVLHARAGETFSWSYVWNNSSRMIAESFVVMLHIELRGFRRLLALCTTHAERRSTGLAPPSAGAEQSSRFHAGFSGCLNFDDDLPVLLTCPVWDLYCTVYARMRRLPLNPSQRLPLRLSIVAIAGVVALVLAYNASQPSTPTRDVHIEILDGRSLLLLPPRDRHTSHPDRPTDLFLS